MGNRAERRQRHRMIPWPKGRRMPFRLKLGAGQKIFTCTCGSGWLTITHGDGVEAFGKHVSPSEEPKPDVVDDCVLADLNPASR